MTAYKDMTKEQLMQEKSELVKKYEEIKGYGLNLDMSRGKPGKEQLDITLPMMDVLASSSDYKCENGMDVRNYGVMDGIPEMKRLLVELLGYKAEQMILYGNSSLNVMYDTVARSMLFGVQGCTPWCKLDKVKFLCPVPGYDRHFAITQQFNIEMINIPLKEDGPDMDMVEELVSKDEAIKGIWCVPKYSNPTGVTYSDEVVKRFAALKPAAKDFRIFWDNAYAIHHLYADNQDELLNLGAECEKAGNPNIYYEFCSTSKVTFPGSGVAALISSVENIQEIKKELTIQTIGHDKVNQLRHVRFFQNADGVKAHMMKHADIIRPKFETVLDRLEQELAPLQIATWTVPKGGYFISLNTLEGCAKKVVEKCKEAGVVMTSAGATYPYGKDPMDSNIRIAPTFPSADELAKAAEVFILCVKLVSVEKLLDA